MIRIVIELIKLAIALKNFFERRGLISQGQNEIIAKLLVKQSYDIDKGKAARLLQRQLDANGVLDDDEFIRPD